ncbi:MAG TPA: hypothetical protein VIJ42_04265 [Stellaceae bacterium]
MIRNLLAGVAALALMTGAALANETYSQSTTVVAPAAPVAPTGDSYSKTRTEKSTDSYGNQTEHRDRMEKSQAMTPDGGAATTTHTHSSTRVAPADSDD